MDWDTLVQGINTVGGISGLIALVGFIAFYSVRIRKENAEARLKEKQGDSESIKPLMDIIEALKDENRRLAEKMEANERLMNERVEKLEAEVKTLREQNGLKDFLIGVYEKASKMCHKCTFIPKGGQCPAVTEYKLLTK
jgi:predicted nuclease with TOPRIM domain